jgi:hypothetical protein
MNTENRKFNRRNIDLAVHIELADGSTVRGTLVDLAEGGVRVKVRHPDNLPDQFMVKLGERLHRWSRIAWRSTDEIGVEFVAAPQAPADSETKHSVLIKCPKTGRNIPTGIRLTAADDLGKLSRARRFTQCPCCKTVHSWLPSEALLGPAARLGPAAC